MKGIPQVLEAERGGSLLARHPFLYAQAPDLLLHSIPDLLACYKVRLLLSPRASSARESKFS